MTDSRLPPSCCVGHNSAARQTRTVGSVTSSGNWNEAWNGGDRLHMFHMRCRLEHTCVFWIAIILLHASKIRGPRVTWPDVAANCLLYLVVAWLDGPRVESRWGWDFPHLSRPAHPASCAMGNGFFPVVKRPERGIDHPTPSSTEVKERVELCLYSFFGPSWPVIGWTLSLPLLSRFIGLPFCH